MSIYSLSMNSLELKKRAEQKVETRGRIVSVAKRLFGERGILATSTAEIARTAELSHGALFVHFRTRDELLNALIDDFGKSLAAELRAEQGEANLRGFLLRHLRVLERYEDFYTRLVIEGPMLPSPSRASLSLLQSTISFELERASEEERSLGQLKPIAPYLLFNTWIALLHYYLANRDLFSPGRSLLQEKGSMLVEHFLTLVSQTPTRGKDE